MDIMSKEERSERMGRVRAKGNRSTEARFRLALVRSGIRGWRLHDQSLLGCPDFAFQERRLAVFIDGCFWHGCPLCKRPLPVANRDYWRNKVNSNVLRARRVNSALRRK